MTPEDDEPKDDATASDQLDPTAQDAVNGEDPGDPSVGSTDADEAEEQASSGWTDEPDDEGGTGEELQPISELEGRGDESDTADVGAGAVDALGDETDLEPDHDGQQATIFQPRALVEPTSTPPPTVRDETVFQPPIRTTELSEPQLSAPPSFPEGVSAPPGLTAIAPAAVSSAERVEVGAVLNGLYEVTRFIARGGMGEVWEGHNINDEHDRVAIKVVLPSLAADPNVQAMFRKEARTLKRLTHAAVVQYRVIASDPRLNILYIVTDFVDGVNLADAMSTLKPNVVELKGLLRRLAEGLRAAHEIGAIHRDMSPDNVILEEGRIDRARIIDFGVAKDLDPSKGTIVGDGFAGKIGFVAPEQFGDFGREVGPWTDVYSLGLVILAVAAGRNPDMGATLVDAVDRRRQGVDLSAVPQDLKPVLAGMLTADPAQRFRSMDAVLAALDGSASAGESVEAQAKGKPGFGKRTGRASIIRQADAPSSANPTQPLGSGPLAPLKAWMADPRHRMIAFGGAGLAVVALAAVIVAVTLTGGEPGPPDAVEVAEVPDGEQVRRAVEAALPNIGCSWLDMDYLEAVPGGVAMRISGAAGDGAAAQSAIQQAVTATGVTITDQNMEGVAAVPPNYCAALDLFRPMRAETSAGARSMTSPQSRWVMETRDGGPATARPVVSINLRDSATDFVLLAINELGGVVLVSKGRNEIDGFVAQRSDNLSKPGPDSYQLTMPISVPGQYALILLSGPGAFDQTLLSREAEARPTWSSDVRQAAAALGWKAEITWHEVTGG